MKILFPLKDNYKAQIMHGFLHDCMMTENEATALRYSLVLVRNASIFYKS